MKNLLFCILIAFITHAASAQQDIVTAPYLRYPTIPPFALLKIDSSTFTKKSLAKNKKTLIVYFSPDCDHCRHQTDSMLAKMDKLKNIQILMATYQPFEEMKAFYKTYRLSRYRNINIGRDVNFFFPPFFKINNLPFLILYNEKGKLLTTFEGITKMDEVLQAFKSPALKTPA